MVFDEKRGRPLLRQTNPEQNRLFFYFGLLAAQYGLVGRIRPLGRVSTKLVVNRVVVNDEYLMVNGE